MNRSSFTTKPKRTPTNEASEQGIIPAADQRITDQITFSPIELVRRIRLDEVALSLSQNRFAALVPTAGLLMVVAAGYTVGSSVGFSACVLFNLLACIAGFVLALAGLFDGSQPVGRKRFGQLMAVGLMSYLVVVLATEPLEFVREERGVLLSIAWLSPLIIGGVLLPRRGYWFVGLGCWSILFAGVVALSYNVSNVHSGIGFFGGWLA